MSPEVLAIMVVGVSLAGLILSGQSSINSRIGRLEAAVHALAERVARLEGAFPFLTAHSGDQEGRDHAHRT